MFLPSDLCRLDRRLTKTANGTSCAAQLQGSVQDAQVGVPGAMGC